MFLGSRVILEQEIFVEVENRICLLCIFSKALHDFLHVGCSKRRNEVIHYPHDTFVQIISGYLLEDLAQEGVGFRDEVRSFCTREIVRSVVVQTRGKHTIRDSLRIDIRKFLWSDIMQKRFTEILHVTTEFGWCVSVLNERLLDDVTQQTRLPCHQLRQFGSRSNTLRTSVFDMLHERNKTVCVRQADLIALYLRQTNRLLPFAMFVQMEIQIIGKDNRVQRSLVAVKLLFVFLTSVEVAVFKVFCFNISNRQVLTEQSQIRRTAINVALLIDNSTPCAIMQKTLERRTERMLGRQTCLIQLIDLLDIRGDKFVHSSVCYGSLLILSCGYRAQKMRTMFCRPH